MIVLLLREALDRLCVRLNVYLVYGLFLFNLPLASIPTIIIAAAWANSSSTLLSATTFIFGAKNVHSRRMWYEKAGAENRRHKMESSRFNGARFWSACHGYWSVCVSVNACIRLYRFSLEVVFNKQRRLQLCSSLHSEARPCLVHL